MDEQAFVSKAAAALLKISFFVSLQVFSLDYNNVGIKPSFLSLWLIINLQEFL